ncbi:site-specific integrase [Arthrobacter sp. TMN-49]
MARFGKYLVVERSSRPTTVVNYLNQVRPFPRWWAEKTGNVWRTVSSSEAMDFLVFRGAEESAGSIRVAAKALRVFLRWLLLDGVISRPAAEGIGPVAYLPYAGLPKFLTTGQVAGCSPTRTSTHCGCSAMCQWIRSHISRCCTSANPPCTDG